MNGGPFEGLLGAAAATACGGPIWNPGLDYATSLVLKAILDH